MLDPTKARRIVDNLGHAYDRATLTMRRSHGTPWHNAQWEVQEVAWQRYDEAHQRLGQFPRGRA